MTVPGYYGCNCDKYNPDCRCYPKPKSYVRNELFKTTRTIESIEADLARIKGEEITTGLGEYSTEELMAEIERRYSPENISGEEIK